MEYCKDNLIPIIPANSYDKVAEEFLEIYYPEALGKPMPVPILEIAKTGLGLDVQFISLSEELDIYGMTIFTDGFVEVYNSDEEVYENKKFKKGTILVDLEVFKRTNAGCANNTISHECVHWYKHRLYYKYQNHMLPRLARYCKCYMNQLPYSLAEDRIMENHAIGIAPRILMPSNSFSEKAIEMGVAFDKDNQYAIDQLSKFFSVSKQSVKIRLEECRLI